MREAGCSVTLKCMRVPSCTDLEETCGLVSSCTVIAQNVARTSSRRMWPWLLGLCLFGPPHHETTRQLQDMPDVRDRHPPLKQDEGHVFSLHDFTRLERCLQLAACDWLGLEDVPTPGGAGREPDPWDRHLRVVSLGVIHQVVEEGGEEVEVSEDAGPGPRQRPDAFDAREREVFWGPGAGGG